VFKQCLQCVGSLCIVLPELVPEAVTVLATAKSKAQTSAATTTAAASSMSADQKRLRDCVDAALQNVLARSEP
jgi:BRCT domain type II-containing protein